MQKASAAGTAERKLKTAYGASLHAAAADETWLNNPKATTT